MYVIIENDEWEGVEIVNRK